MSRIARSSGEFERIARIKGRLGSREDAWVRVGIGDDAAVLSPPAGCALVVTVDAQVEHVHFRREWLSWRDLGYRAVMAAGSDVAAMGAVPWSVVTALALPRTFDDDSLDALVDGIGEASEQLGAPVVGGNLSASSEVSLTTTVLGTVSGSPVSRAGARVGDGVWLAGPVGLAGVGLRRLMRASTCEEDVAVAAWRRPTARIRDGQAMVGVAHAAIDVSDGLMQDLGHIAQASGVKIVVDAHSLLAGETALESLAIEVGEDPLRLALGGGEDYALVALSPVALSGFRRIGHVVAGEGVEIVRDGRTLTIEPGGFNHFE